MRRNEWGLHLRAETYTIGLVGDTRLCLHYPGLRENEKVVGSSRTRRWCKREDKGRRKEGLGLGERTLAENWSLGERTGVELNPLSGFGFTIRGPCQFTATVSALSWNGR